MKRLYKYLNWDRAWSSRWYWILAGLLAYEFWSAFDRNGRTPALTHVLVEEVPGWVVMTTIAWLAVHFGTRYYGGMGWLEFVALVLVFLITFLKGR